MHRNTVRTAINPALWRDWASAANATTTAPRQLDGAFLQCWTGTRAKMRQPALDHHMIVLHQGGAKHVRRTGGTRPRLVDVPNNAITTIEAGSIYNWHTEGPIAFSHMYVAPKRFATLVGETFNRDPGQVSCAEVIGRPDRHAADIFQLMIASREDPDWNFIGDAYLVALIVRLAATSTWGGHFRCEERLSLTGHTLAKVRDYIRGNLDQTVTLGDLAAVAGYSRYHFARAFKAATGLPPYGFLLQERVAAAQAMLREGDLPIGDVARRTGFATHAHFSTRFRRIAGLTPADYRRHHGVIVRSPEPVERCSAD